MKKAIKVLLKIAAAGAILLAVAAVVVPILLKKYLPPEKVRELIVDNARTRLKREVRLKDISLGALKGLSVSGLEISESPDFKAGTFAQAETFQLRVRLLPLLHATVAVDRIVLGGLRVNVKKGADGLYNFSDIAGSTQPAKASPAKALPILLDIQHIALSDGKVSYADAGTGDALTVSEITAQITDLSLNGDTAADVSFKAAGKVAKKPVAASVSFSGTINPANLNLDKVAVAVKKVSVEAPEGKASASGSIRGARSPELDLRAQLALKGSEPVSIEVKGKVNDLASKAPSASLAVKAHTPVLKSGDFKAYGAPDGLTLPPADVETKFDLAGDLLTLKSLDLKANGVSAEVSGSVNNFRDKPDLTIAAKLHVPKLAAADLAFLKAYKVEPPASGTPAAEVETQFHLASNAAEVKSFHLSSLANVVDASGRVAGLGSGRLEPSFDVSAKLAVPELTSADLSLLKAYKVSVPDGMTVPAMAVNAKLHYTPDEVSVSAFHFENPWGKADAAGTVRRIRSGRPEGTVNGSVHLRLPQVTAKDLSALKMIPKLSIPASLAWPASQADADFKFDGVNLDISRLHVQNTMIAFDAIGGIRKLTTAPEPHLAVKVKTDLPAFASADISFVPSVPPGLMFPASHFEMVVDADPDKVSLKALNLRTKSGLNDLSITESGVGSLRSDKPFFVLHVDGVFNLEELRKFAPQAAALDLAGSGRMAHLSVGGRLPKGGNPSFGDVSGALGFKGLGVTAAGLKLSEFAADFKFDKQYGTIESKEIKGKIGPGTLTMDLTVSNYNVPHRELKVQIQSAHLDQFDVGAFLDAKSKMAKSGADQAAVEVKPFSLSIKDGFTVDKLAHPYAVLEKANLQCDLSGITPDFKQLDGDAKFNVGGGHLLDLEKIANQNPLVRVMTVPILIMRGLGIFPNLKDIAFSELSGDYKIARGVVDIKEFHLLGDKLSVVINQGTVDLPGDKVHMDVSVKAGAFGMNKVICGSISKPDVGCVSGEIEKQARKKVGELLNPGKTVQDAADLPGNVLQGTLNLLKPK